LAARKRFQVSRGNFTASNQIGKNQNLHIHRPTTAHHHPDTILTLVMTVGTPPSEAKLEGLEFMKYQTAESDHATSNPSNPDALRDSARVEMSSQNSQFNNGMEVDSVLSPTSQSAAIPESKDQEDMPPYVKSIMKQMESISSASQEQTKTNSILAGTLNMLVEIFARMEEGISSV
jgi:hypothetical protein